MGFTKKNDDDILQVSQPTDPNHPNELSVEVFILGRSIRNVGISGGIDCSDI